MPLAPKLGYVNCDHQPILCSIWASGVPTLWHFQVPVAQPDQSKPATTLHIVPLNTTTTTTQDIVKIHTEQTYKEIPPYEGLFHPIDGWLAKLGLLTPLGYGLWAFALVPSWAFMIGISFLSRSFM